MHNSDIILACICYITVGVGVAKSAARAHDINRPSEKFWFTLLWPVVTAFTAFCANWEK